MSSGCPWLRIQVLHCCWKWLHFWLEWPWVKGGKMHPSMLICATPNPSWWSTSSSGIIADAWLSPATKMVGFLRSECDFGGIELAVHCPALLLKSSFVNDVVLLIWQRVRVIVVPSTVCSFKAFDFVRVGSPAWSRWPPPPMASHTINPARPVEMAPPLKNVPLGFLAQARCRSGVSIQRYASPSWVFLGPTEGKPLRWRWPEWW